MHRIAPQQLASSALRLAPFAWYPRLPWVVLVFQVDRVWRAASREGGKDYWAKNLKTWLDAPLPDIARADVALKLNPSKHWLASTGTFTLVNGLDTTLTQIPLTGGRIGTT